MKDLDKQEKYYYEIKDDIEAFPDAWTYIVYGGRAVGKTYGALSLMLDLNEKFVFCKRTIDDTKLICAGNSLYTVKNIKRCENTFNVDLSPFKSINRDRGTNIRAFQIYDGLGVFYHCDENNYPIDKDPIGYILALSAISKFRGFDLSECTYMIFDEFVPKSYDRIVKNEGYEILDLYKTVARDREHRGLPPLKLICLANADKVNSPVANTLEITDDVAQMQLQQSTYFYNEHRGIFIRRIKKNEAFLEREMQSKINIAMAGTQWGKMSTDNDFAFDDFSYVNKLPLKKCKGICSFSYNNKTYYLYAHPDGTYYICQSQHKIGKHYDLSRTGDKRSFNMNVAYPLRRACELDKFVCCSYSVYELIMNFVKIMNL